ncbi:lysosomal protective protein [Strongylocentrotus purpuratus]|uniref:Carboxypeptidase n=1 Tax=Strongylocentrotus purpuratus TaxID=7668 RepID=A0A7M7N6T4_STRPU|nr:lysosomal protective protein [Strongylocentrotus purpuratus]
MIRMMTGNTVPVLLVLLSLWSSAVLGAQKADLITNLPGLAKQPSFNQYSGYLSGTANHMLHYWYVESENSPTKDPLIVWLGDGPGCSALYSILAGNGPYLVKENGYDLDYNDNSWNKFANILYIESPAGVGFSYSTDGLTKSDDNQVTSDHVAALQFFLTEFPEVISLPMYIMGEGYGGVYAPLLALKIQQTTNITTLKGFAVGNGMTSEEQLANSLIYFTYYRGIIGDQLWSTLQLTCCVSGKCNFYNSSVAACSVAVDKALMNVDSIGLNPYNILTDCVGEASPPGGALQKDGYVHYGTSPSDVFRYSKYAQSRQMFLHKRPSHKMRQDIQCVNTSLVTGYLSSPYVREALHIDGSRPAWQVCNAEVAQNYIKLYPDLTSTYIALQQTYKYRVLVYNGDVDAMSNCLGDEWFVDALGLEEEVQWRTWLYSDGSLQIAGFVKEYDRVAFATVKGAGHMTAADKPIATAQLISNFVGDKPF